MLQHVFKTLLTVFHESSLEQGLHLMRQGAVLNVRLSDGLLHARVKDPPGLYDVYADLKTWPTTTTRCQCTVRSNCKHAAASFLTLKTNQLQSNQPLDHWLHEKNVHILKDPAVSSSAVYKHAQAHDPALPSAWAETQQVHVNDLAWYQEQTTIDHAFFSCELGILVDGEKVNLVPALTRWIQAYDLEAWEALPDDWVFHVSTQSGKVVTLPVARLRPLMIFLLYDHVPHNTTNIQLTFRRYQWALLQDSLNALTSTTLRILTPAQLFSQLNQFMSYQTLPDIAIPTSCTATLRDYQRQGVNWLQALKACQFSGILADDMGLGKTLQTLVHLLIEKEAGRLQQPVLIIAPLSLLGNWQAEAARFTPTIRVSLHHGAKRSLTHFQEADLILSTYGLIQRDYKLFTSTRFDCVILDEAQWIKNAKTKTTLIIQQLQATHRLCLSGTPFENHLGELWSLFHFLMPGLLGSKRQFKTYFQNPIEKVGDPEKSHQLLKRIQPFLLRRTKSQVLMELPSKTEIIQPITLQNAQRDLYESIRVSMEKKVQRALLKQGLQKSRFIVLDALLKLRQVCCDPRLLSLPYAHTAHGVSAKLDALMNLVETLIDEKRTLLIFSQFTSMLALIESKLQAQKLRYLKLTGQTKNRRSLIENFQTGNTPIFLISLKAGGVGLNLTQADVVIHYDPWWNPAVEDQATDRTHRIGQQHPVFVYRLVASHTVEEIMMNMQVKKRALFNSLLSTPEAGISLLHEEDVLSFFQPID